MNSTAEQEVNIGATEISRVSVLPTQHSITRSRVSFAHATSSGSNSEPSRRDFEEEREGKGVSSRRSRAARHPRQTEGGNETSDEDDPYLESFLPPSPWAKTNRHRSGHRVPLCRTWGCAIGVMWGWLTGVACKRGVDSYYSSKIEFLVVPYIPIPSRASAVGQGSRLSRSRTIMVCSSFFRSRSERAGLTGLLGRSSKPQTLHAGADGEGRLRQAQVGTRIQGFPGLD